MVKENLNLSTTNFRQIKYHKDISKVVRERDDWVMVEKKFVYD